MGMTFRKGRFSAHRIAARRLDLDHVHPKIAQQLAAKGAHGGAQVENAVAGE